MRQLSPSRRIEVEREGERQKERQKEREKKEIIKILFYLSPSHQIQKTPGTHEDTGRFFHDAHRIVTEHEIQRDPAH